MNDAREQRRRRPRIRGLAERPLRNEPVESAFIGRGGVSADDSVLMEINGTVCANLVAAIASARRWRGRAVHEDTLRYWGGLLEHARRARLHRENVDDLVMGLEAELAARA